jgi:hypothetical protein
MDLAEILKKTKAKSDRVIITRKPPSIANEDRPYSVLDSKSSKPVCDQTSSKPQGVFNINENILGNHETSFKVTGNNSVTKREKTSSKLATKQ